MKNEEIVRALRCVSTAGGENACEHCPYWKEEEVPEEERPIYGADTMHSCDVDRVGLDGADLIERLTDRCARYAEEIAVAQERTRWIPVTERLPEVWRNGETAVLVNYMIYSPYFGVDIGSYHAKARTWLCMGLPITVTHWMPLPEPPEEVE